MAVTYRAEPLRLDGPRVVSARWSRGMLRPSPLAEPTPLALVMECPDYVEFQEVIGPIPPEWAAAMGAKTRSGYRCLWLVEEMPSFGAANDGDCCGDGIKVADGEMTND